MLPLNPLTQAVQLTIDAPCFPPIDAAIGNPAVDPILQELNALARAFGATAPESVAVPALAAMPALLGPAIPTRLGCACATAPVASNKAVAAKRTFFMSFFLNINFTYNHSQMGT